MEDDVGRAGQVAEVGRVHQVLAQARPFLVVAIQVDVIRRMDGKRHAVLFTGFLDGRAGRLTDAHAVHPGQLEGVQADGGGILNPAHRPAGPGRGGCGGTDGAEIERKVIFIFLYTLGTKDTRILVELLCALCT